MSDYSQNEKNGISAATAVLLIGLSLVAGYGLGFYNVLQLKNTHTAQEQTRPNLQQAENQRRSVPLGMAPKKGGTSPQVVIVTFSDYQCPYCKKGDATMDALLAKYGNKLAVYHRQHPLDNIHAKARPAAKAALAAKEQGDSFFWAYHKKLFDNQNALDNDSLLRYAEQVGLDVEKFKKDLTNNDAKYDRSIEEDIALSVSVGARGTPAFFVNGIFVSGAQPVPVFSELIDQEIITTNKLLSSGIPQGNLYENILKQATPPIQATRPAAPAPKKEQDMTIYAVPVENSITEGADDAIITLVEFSDFKCGFCAKAERTLFDLMAKYKEKLRIVYKQALTVSGENTLAARAFLAAHKFGKGSEMRSWLYENSKNLSAQLLEDWAQSHQLPLKKFTAALNDPKIAQQVEAENKLFRTLGGNGTPWFFVNGRLIRGAESKEVFESLIDKSIKEYESISKSSSVKPKDFYNHLQKDAKTSTATPSAPNPIEFSKVAINAGNGPFLGKKDSPVTILVTSDFECPFCKKGAELMRQVYASYKNDVRIVFRHYPLPFHSAAKPAAIAAMAAGKQNKFWEMHDLLFENQAAWQKNPAFDFGIYATKLGLDMEKFKLDIKNNDELTRAINSDIDYINQKETEPGTPTFYINGKRIPGIYPLEIFKKIIDEELKTNTAGTKKLPRPKKAAG